MAYSDSDSDSGIKECGHYDEYRECTRDDGDGWGGTCDDCGQFYCDRHESDLSGGLCADCRKGDPFEKINKYDWSDDADSYNEMDSSKQEKVFAKALIRCIKINGYTCLKEHQHHIEFESLYAGELDFDDKDGEYDKNITVYCEALDDWWDMKKSLESLEEAEKQ